MAATHWYFMSTWGCPVCGHENTLRFRRTGAKPTEWAERHEYVERYDWCNG